MYVEGRFFLSFNKVTTGISTQRQGTTAIFAKGSQLQVICNDNIREVQIFDMQGREILNETDIESPVYSRDLARNGMFIVKVLTGQGLVIKKITTAN